MTEPELNDNILISYCGICCSLCPLFRSEKCHGCPELLDCNILQCAKSKDIRYCFLCEEFPCKMFQNGFEWNLDTFPDFKKYNLGTVKWKPYSRHYIKLFLCSKTENHEIKNNKSHLANRTQNR